MSRRLMSVMTLAAALSVGCAGTASSGTPESGARSTGAAAGDAVTPDGAANGGAPSAGSGGRSVTLSATDWPTYHRTRGRSGYAPATPPVTTLGRKWTARLGQAVYGQPLVVGTTVIAATERNTVYALAKSTGRVLWQRHLAPPQARSGLPCGNIDPLGITSTPVLDPATGRVFVLAETDGGHHVLYGLALTDGAVAVRATVEPPRGDPLAHQQRGALALANGRVYVAYGGLEGDCSDYIGSVVSVRTDGTGRVSWAVPTSREGGIWATPGPVVDAAGNVLVAIGNGESTSTYDGSDSVTKLSPTLRRLGYFAPTGWADDNRADADLGSLGPTLVGNFVYADGKRGVGYVLDAAHLGGIGGQVSSTNVCAAFGGTAVVDATVYVPCTDGIRAVHISSTGAISVAWHQASGGSSPVVGGGAVWSVDTDSGELYALRPGDGTVRAHINVGAVPHFASPTLSGPTLLVGTMTGVTAVSGA